MISFSETCVNKIHLTRSEHLGMRYNTLLMLSLSGVYGLMYSNDCVCLDGQKIGVQLSRRSGTRANASAVPLIPLSNIAGTQCTCVPIGSSIGQSLSGTYLQPLTVQQPIAIQQPLTVQPVQMMAADTAQHISGIHHMAEAFQAAQQAQAVQQAQTVQLQQAAQVAQQAQAAQAAQLQQATQAAQMAHAAQVAQVQHAAQAAQIAVQQVKAAQAAAQQVQAAQHAHAAQQAESAQIQQAARQAQQAQQVQATETAQILQAAQQVAQAAQIQQAQTKQAAQMVQQAQMAQQVQQAMQQARVVEAQMQMAQQLQSQAQAQAQIQAQSQAQAQAQAVEAQIQLGQQLQVQPQIQMGQMQLQSQPQMQIQLGQQLQAQPQIQLGQLIGGFSAIQGAEGQTGSFSGSRICDKSFPAILAGSAGGMSSLIGTVGIPDLSSAFGLVASGSGGMHECVCPPVSLDIIGLGSGLADLSSAVEEGASEKMQKGGEAMGIEAVCLEKLKLAQRTPNLQQIIAAGKLNMCLDVIGRSSALDTSQMATLLCYC